MRWLLTALLAVSGPVSSQDNAHRWLNEMSSALQSLNYDGTFVYLHDGKLETMRIVHQTGEPAGPGQNPEKRHLGQ